MYVKRNCQNTTFLKIDRSMTTDFLIIIASGWNKKCASAQQCATNSLSRAGKVSGFFKLTAQVLMYVILLELYNCNGMNKKIPRNSQIDSGYRRISNNISSKQNKNDHNAFVNNQIFKM